MGTAGDAKCQLRDAQTQVFGLRARSHLQGLLAMDGHMSMACELLAVSENGPKKSRLNDGK